MHCDIQTASDDKKIQNQQKQQPQQPEFLAGYRKNEISGSLRQKLELGLLAV